MPPAPRPQSFLPESLWVNDSEHSASPVGGANRTRRLALPPALLASAPWRFNSPGTRAPGTRAPSRGENLEQLYTEFFTQRSEVRRAVAATRWRRV